jgi:superfamily II RNA helicase
MTGRAGRRGKDRVGFIIAAPGPHQDPRKIAELLSAPPNDLDSQFRASTLRFSICSTRSAVSLGCGHSGTKLAYRNLLPRIHQLEKTRQESAERIRERIAPSSLDISDRARFERLASARSRLIEGAPHTRREMRQRWLNTSGAARPHSRRGPQWARSLDHRARGGRRDRHPRGRPSTSFPLQRIGRVFTPTFSTRPERVDEAFDQIHARADELALAEPRLRDAQSGEEDSIRLISDLIDSSAANTDLEMLWSLQTEAASIERAGRQIEGLRAEIWEPFERCARVLDSFGYLDFFAERLTERGKWLADLRVDRPLLIGEALKRELFASLDVKQTSALIAALVADEDRDYGELELDDPIVSLLIKFEEVSLTYQTRMETGNRNPRDQLSRVSRGALG